MSSTGMTVEEGLPYLEGGIVKARKILLGFAPNELFTSEEYMNFYHCVYRMCICTSFKGSSLCEWFQSRSEETITYVMWANYQRMAKFLSGLFHYYEEVKSCKEYSIYEILINCFSHQVCNQLFRGIEHALVSLINQERKGKQVDQQLLKGFLTFFNHAVLVSRVQYENFEKTILSDAAAYYSGLASQMHNQSCSEYIHKVDLVLNQERQRASQYLPGTTVEKLIQALTWKLLVQNASRLTEKQEAESNVLASYHQELLSKYASMSLEERAYLPNVTLSDVRMKGHN